MGECFERFKMGCLMGASVGGCIGLLFGSYAVMRYNSLIRYGHGGSGAINVIGKAVLQSGASFGFFMGIGGMVRCDSKIKRLH